MSSNNLPNFLIVGVAKSGTTTLVSYLDDSKEIFISHKKEPRYLTYNFLKESGYNGPGDHRPRSIAVKSLEEYKSLFQNVIKPTHKVIGEASVDTFYYYKHTIPKIKKELGDPKIIIMLRNPVERAISAYSHLIREEREELSFEKALEKGRCRLDKGYEYIWGYENGGLYYEPTKAFIESFSKVKVVIFEEFISNQKKIMSEIFEFLDVEDQPTLVNQAHNISGKPKNRVINKFLTRNNMLKRGIRKIIGNKTSLHLKNKIQKFNLEKININSETKIKLFKKFESDIEKLENLLQKDLSDWKKYTNEI